MFKKFIIGKLIDLGWKFNNFTIVFKKSKKRLEIGFDLKEDDFEIIKNKLIDKVTKEIVVEE